MTLMKKLQRNESIEVSIGVNGEIEINALGFIGRDCEEATAFLEQALGTAGTRVHKPQFHARRKVRNANQQKLAP